MLVFMGELLRVDTDEDFKTITFESEKWDRGLGKNVPCSVQVILDESCYPFIHNYKSNIGTTISIAVRTGKKVNAGTGAVWLICSSDVLDVTEMLTV